MLRAACIHADCCTAALAGMFCIHSKKDSM
jgi:hypothetical protein